MPATSPLPQHVDRASYTRQLRDELARVAHSHNCCQRVAATVLLRWQLAGAVARRGANMQLRCANHPVASRLAGLLEVTINPATPTMLTVPVASWRAAIRRLELFDHAGRPRQGLPTPVVTRILGGRDCDPATAWRTAILTAGELASSPRTTPKLSVTCPNLLVALVLIRAARKLNVSATLPSGGQQQALETGAPVAVTVRGQQALEQLLHRLGAPQSAAALTPPPSAAPPSPPSPARNKRDHGGLDTSNRDRASAAARKQTAQVRAALDVMGDSAPPAELAAGRLRLNHPDASLTELGQLVDPPLGKDIIAGRLRRLLAHAQRHRSTD